MSDAHNEPEAVDRVFVAGPEGTTVQTPQPPAMPAFEVRVGGLWKLLVAKVTSRKFLIAVASAVYFLTHHDYAGAEGIVLGYLGVQGAADAIATHKGAPVASTSLRGRL